MRVGSVVFCALLVLGACASERAVQPSATVSDSAGLRVFDAAMAIQDEWLHMPIKGRTEYRLAHLDGRLGIRARGMGGASGLTRRVEIDSERCPWIEWTWRVERLQASADLNSREHEDVAASLFSLFGDLGLISMPDPVPTLRYVWTNEAVPAGSIVDNPYLPGVVRSIVVRSGQADTGRWVTERRNLHEDFVAAFGSEPPEPVHVVALFTDNDQTEEPVEAYYGQARSLCRG